VNIHTQNQLGGDGFAVWLLDENEIKRPQMAADGNVLPFDAPGYESLMGDFYGLRPDFNGTGVIFDTYDNDNNADNPVVFTVVNDGKPRQWSMNDDLTPSRRDLKELSKKLFNPLKQHELMPSECTLDYHGKESAKILIRYQAGSLHVYTDQEHAKIQGTDVDKLNLIKKHALPLAFGRHFGMIEMLSKLGMMVMPGAPDIPNLCLVRSIDLKSWKNPHIAISAITGQLSDNHDILKLETKYIRTEHKINDAELPQAGYKERNSGILVKIYWSMVCVLSLGLIAETLGEIWMIAKIYKSARNVVNTINKINPFIQLSYILNSVQYVLLVFAFNWKCILCNSPLLVIRAHKFMTNNVLLTPQTFEQPYFTKTTYRQWLWVQLILLCLSGFYHFWRLFHA